MNSIRESSGPVRIPVMRNLAVRGAGARRRAPTRASTRTRAMHAFCTVHAQNSATEVQGFIRVRANHRRLARRGGFRIRFYQISALLDLVSAPEFSGVSWWLVSTPASGIASDFSIPEHVGTAALFHIPTIAVPDSSTDLSVDCNSFIQAVGKRMFINC